MKSQKKPWRTFKKKESHEEKQICWWIRRTCSIILIVEAAVLWKQADIPAIRVEKQENSWMVLEEGEEGSMLERMFGVRLRVEEGTIEFYRKEEAKNID